VSGSKKTPAAAVALVQKKASKTPHVASHYASLGWPIVRPRGEYESNASWRRPYPEGRWGGYAADGDYSYRPPMMNPFRMRTNPRHLVVRRSIVDLGQGQSDFDQLFLQRLGHLNAFQCVSRNWPDLS